MTFTVDDQVVAAVLGSMLRAKLMALGRVDALLDADWSVHNQHPNLTGLDGLDVHALASDVCNFWGMEEPRSAALAAELIRSENLLGWVEVLGREMGGGIANLCFSTSGSTGVPTTCVHAMGDLVQEASFWAATFAHRQRVVGLVPRHHIYGFLFTILLPRLLNVPVVFAPPLATAGLVAKLLPGDLVIAFPNLWKSLCALSAGLPADVHGVTSTAPCPAQVILDLLERGLTTMTEIYGSSETGGIGFRHHPNDPYTLIPHWNRAAADSHGTNLRKRRPDGSLGDAMAIPDALQWEGAQTFRPLKRQDKAVQVGGINVYPHRIAEILSDHPLVAACSVRLMRPDEGDRLKAFVVSTKADPGPAERQAIRTWLSSRLAAAEMPKTITFGPALPQGIMGKAADWNIA